MNKRVISLFFCVVLFVSMFTLHCSAAEADIYVVTTPDSGEGVMQVIGETYEVSSSDPQYKGYFRGDYDSRHHRATVYISEYFSIKSYEAQTSMMEELISDISDSDEISPITKQAIYTSISNVVDAAIVAYIPDIIDMTTADVNAGLAAFMPFSGVFGIILGGAVVLIVVVLLFTTVFDLAYIGSPGLAGWLLESQDAHGKWRIKLVSREALAVVKEAAQGECGNVYVSYLRKRWVTYIVLAVCILYLLSGQIATLFSSLFGLAERITN